MRIKGGEGGREGRSLITELEKCSKKYVIEREAAAAAERRMQIVI